ncbi:hypothetical protein N7499_004724 [Penicillium canescens]|nr:hypothetical protein N7499_004724 [Penicillium canescens]KAJ6161879.1 hypothetical protein N7485_010109 [Penicillium canescens]
MAFQISIGDALMLSKLAYDIALAFTSGRKSAPAQFQEVQNQLYSLSTALESFKSLSTEGEEQTNQRPVDGISAIIQNCRMTLKHLELLVNKYMVIQDQDDKSKPQKRQWSAEISKNWKKVQWTREGGDLAKLQHNLGVHINSLNLAVAVTNSILYESHRPLEWTVAILENLAILSQSIQTYAFGNTKYPPIAYCPGSIEMIQMVHYRNLSESLEWIFHETADVMFHLQSEKGHVSSLDDRVVRLHFTIDCQTRFTVGESTSTVCVHQTDCLSVTEAGQENMAKGVDAEIELCDDSAANYLFRQLKYLQEGLLFFKIQQIQRYEKLVFQLPLGLLMIYNYHLADATLRLGLNVEKDIYRLLLSNGSKSISMSIEVPPESLSQIPGTEEPCISLNALNSYLR